MELASQKVWEDVREAVKPDSSVLTLSATTVAMDVEMESEISSSRTNAAARMALTASGGSFGSSETVSRIFTILDRS